MKKILLFLTGVFFVSFVMGQSGFISSEHAVNETLNWKEPLSFTGLDEERITLLYFENATYNFPQDSLPQYSKSFFLPDGTAKVYIDFSILRTETLTDKEKKALVNQFVSDKIQPKSIISWYRKQTISTISFYPVYRDKITNELRKVVTFKFKLTPIISRINKRSALDFKVNSVLRSGTWVKVGVVDDAVYKVTYDEMKSMGLNVTNISSDQVRLFGNGGGHLPFDNSVPRFDDLEENAIEVFDGGDGVFNSGDYFLFYGQSPHRWKYNNGGFAHVTHLFSDTTYYFITTDYQIGYPKRIATQAAISGTADVTVDNFTDFQYYEKDLVNFVKSGRNWYGESYNYTKEREFIFSFPNIIPNSSEIKSTVAFRVINRPASFSFLIANNEVLKLSSPGVSAGQYSNYATLESGKASFNSTSDKIVVKTKFNNSSTSANAWLDYIEIITKRSLYFTGNQMTFRSELSSSANIIEYQLGNSTGYRVWNVTHPTEIKQMLISNGKMKAFGGQINEFIAFDNSGYKSVKSFGIVPNQDLHAIMQADYVIVTHPRFVSQANQLADFHRKNSNLKTVVVTTQQLYNEFSSGAQDITAIKMFNKMLYDRAGSNQSKMLKYVLLLGDASYDYKHRFPDNTNDIPAYQSWNSYSVIQSYISDDYIGFLDDNESDKTYNTLDIGIGRIIAHTTTEAQAIVDKTIHYMTSEACMRPWRNWLTFVGDDEDGNEYMTQSDWLAKQIDSLYDNYNINKIYLDAYQQVSNAGGSTYPDVNTAIDKATEQGSVIINYIGHGGELGLAHERILGLNQINNYKNIDNLPLYLTATCEFSRFDDPERTSAGEYMLLNARGGAVALLTTTRLVYSSSNFELSQKFYNVAFEKEDGQWPRFGDLLRISKIGGSNINYRNFSLLGDPAAQLPYATYGARITSIPDTIKSLQKVTIKGIITDANGQKVTNFNGIVYPTVFGQRKIQKTLNNDVIYGEFEFETQTNALFSGKASVLNGEYEFSFIVPKDIDYKPGSGRISLYAQNGKIDASGYDENFLIGDQIDNPNIDNEGPSIQLWMNDESFIMGGLTDENPLVYAKIFDESGINTVGSGIGHDIVAILDENSSNAITLNDYYEPDLNSYQSGTISYTLSNLPEGKHTLRLKVWDVYNNSSEAYTEFVVSNSGEFRIENVLNYPNPFTTNTDFYFDHNAIGQQLDIRIQIFSVSGKLVKTIDVTKTADTYRVGPINWDGRDEYGDRIGKGTYIYKVKVSNSFGQTTEKFEKIVIM